KSLFCAMRSTTCSTVPLLHDDASRPQELAIEAVSGLEDLGDGVIVFARQRWLGRNGLVQLRIERLVERIDHLQPCCAQRLEHFLLDKLDALMERGRIGRGR